MSLHDQLLADLEDLDGGLESGAEGEDAEAAMIDAAQAMETAADGLVAESVHDIAKVANGPELAAVLERIQHYTDNPQEQVVGPVEEDPQYKLIVEANNLTVEIDNEIGVVHNFCRDQYVLRPRVPACLRACVRACSHAVHAVHTTRLPSVPGWPGCASWLTIPLLTCPSPPFSCHPLSGRPPLSRHPLTGRPRFPFSYAKRFPELEQLVREPLDYMATVKLLLNGLDTADPALKEVLAPATIMVVSVTASTTQG